MPSRRITDCENKLADAWLQTRDEYESTHAGRTLGLSATARSVTEQFELFKVGRVLNPAGLWVPDDDPKTFILTNDDGTVKKSNHNYTPSRALDFFIEIQGKPVWDIRAYIPVGAIAQRLGLVWGGTWGAPATMEELTARLKARKFVDGCHLELP